MRGKRARVRELSRAEPPDAEDRQSARRRGFILVRERQHAARRACAEQMVECGGKHRVRGSSEGARNRLEWPGAGDVGERGDERGSLLGFAQPGVATARAAAIAAGSLPDFDKRILERGIGGPCSAMMRS